MNAAVKDVILGMENPHVGDVALNFSHAAEVLSVATRDWSIVPPRSACELEFAAIQLEGMRRSLVDLKSAMQKWTSRSGNCGSVFTCPQHPAEEANSEQDSPKSADESIAPKRVPLDDYAPSIYDVARWTNDDIDRLRTILEAMERIGEYNGTTPDPAVRGKLHCVAKLALIGKLFADDVHNVHDCQIADCMLASKDPEVRKAARP